MATYLLAWTPNKWTWVDLQDKIERVAQGEAVPDRWSVGNTRKVQIGDRVFLIRLGEQPRGIMASGWVTEAPFPHEHWDPARAAAGDTAHSVMIEYDVLLDPLTELLLVDPLRNDPRTSSMHWLPQRSGIEIPPQVARTLEKIWSLHTGAVRFRSPDEIPRNDALQEGSRKRILVNQFERSPAARAACIQFHGTSCCICGFDFAKVHGDIGQGYIHVHHLVPLSQIDHSYEVDPVTDLRPVCPNCHAMLHRRNPPFSMEEIKQTIHRDGHSAPL